MSFWGKNGLMIAEMTIMILLALLTYLVVEGNIPSVTEWPDVHAHFLNSLHIEGGEFQPDFLSCWHDDGG